MRSFACCCVLPGSISLVAISQLLTPRAPTAAATAQTLFSFCGTVVECRIAGDSKQFAFVEYQSNAEAVQALGLNGMLIADRQLRVEIAKTVRLVKPTPQPNMLLQQQLLLAQQQQQARMLAMQQQAAQQQQVVAGAQAAQRAAEISRRLAAAQAVRPPAPLSPPHPPHQPLTPPTPAPALPPRSPSRPPLAPLLSR